MSIGLEGFRKELFTVFRGSQTSALFGLTPTPNEDFRAQGLRPSAAFAKRILVMVWGLTKPEKCLNPVTHNLLNLILLNEFFTSEIP